MSLTYEPWEVSRAMWDKETGDVAYILDGIKEARADHGRMISAAPDMLRALEAASRFISNGVELGYIQLPESGDPALETPGIIEAAMKKARSEE